MAFHEIEYFLFVRQRAERTLARHGERTARGGESQDRVQARQFRHQLIESIGRGIEFGQTAEQAADERIAGRRGVHRIDHLITELPRLHAALRFASACGALTVTRQGSFSAIPDEAEVLNFMETYA